MMKVFILYARENWISDELAKEWISNNTDLNTNNLNEADTIWILSNYIIDNIPIHIYKTKKVITTIHHITPWKVDNIQLEHFNKLNRITDIFHSICELTTIEMKKYFTKKIVTFPFWHNENIWKEINNKNELRNKYKLDNSSYLIGSFQRDTEGGSINDKTYKPKLEKGPDIFCKSVILLKNKYPNLKVLLTGSRRQFIINELKKNNIEFYYFEMCNFKTLNELYNCLDLYIVGSRVEGGPRAINECSLTKVPILVTNVGIASLLCHSDSIFDMNNINSIIKCNTNIDYNFCQAQKYTIKNYMKEFTKKLLN